MCRSVRGFGEAVSSNPVDQRGGAARVFEIRRATCKIPPDRRHIVRVECEDDGDLRKVAAGTANAGTEHRASQGSAQRFCDAPQHHRPPTVFQRSRQPTRPDGLVRVGETGWDDWRLAPEPAQAGGGADSPDRIQQLWPIVPWHIHGPTDRPDLQHIVLSRSQHRSRITLNLSQPYRPILLLYDDRHSIM